MSTPTRRQLADKAFKFLMQQHLDAHLPDDPVKAYLCGFLTGEYEREETPVKTLGAATPLPAETPETEAAKAEARRQKTLAYQRERRQRLKQEKERAAAQAGRNGGRH